MTTNGGKDGLLEDGPWIYRAKLSGSENHKGYLVGKDGVGIVADVMPLDEDGKGGEKVARLIASAPDLLEALKEAQGWVEEYAIQMGSYTISDDAKKSLKKIRAAIARAEGMPNETL